MKFLLDTNICIAHLRGRSPAVSARLADAGPDAVLCSPVVMELRFGVELSGAASAELHKVEHFLDAYDSLPFDDAAAKQAARIRAHLHRAGTPIGPYDLLIAAIALEQSLTLVSLNIREFARIPALKTEAWGQG